MNNNYKTVLDECSAADSTNSLGFPGICLPLQVDYSDNVQRDLLDALLRAKRSSENNNTSSHDVGLTEDHLLMTVGDIFGAGVETTSTVLKWSIAYLVHYPQVNKAALS